MTKIMIVDDEPDIVTSLISLLENEGYDVVSAKDGGECLAILKEESPDLILLDFFMPGMSGREVLERIKSEGKLSDIPIIFLTVAEFREMGLKKFKKLGISGYLPTIVWISLI